MLLQDFNLGYQNVSKTLRVSKKYQKTIHRIRKNRKTYQNVSKRIKTYQNVSETLFVSKIGRIKKHGRSDTLGRIKNVFDMISGVSKNQNICKINGSDLPRIRNF